MESVSWLYQQLVFWGVFGCRFMEDPYSMKVGQRGCREQHIFQEYEVQVKHTTSVISIYLEFSRGAMSSYLQSLGDVIPSWATIFPAEIQVVEEGFCY